MKMKLEANPEKLREQLIKAASDLELSVRELAERDREEKEARRAATSARNRLTASQKQFDAVVAEIRRQAGAPGVEWNTDLPGNRFVPLIHDPQKDAVPLPEEG